MINMDYVSSEVQGILAMLDACELPGGYGYLTGIIDEDGSVTDEPIMIANTLTGPKKTLVFPEFLIGFIEEMWMRFSNNLVGSVPDRLGHDVMLIPDDNEHFTVVADVVVSPPGSSP